MTTQDPKEKEHQLKVLVGDEVAQAKQRLMDFADSLPEDASGDRATYADLMSKVQEYLDMGDYWSEGGRFEGQDLYNTFWEDYELVTQTKVEPNNKYGFFSCSC